MPRRISGFVMMLVLMVVGGGSGSTAGGLKQARVYVLWRAVVWEVRRMVLPRRAVQVREVWQGESRVAVTDRQVGQAGLLMLVYLGLLVAGAAVLLGNGYGFSDSLFEMASALGTVGLSVGVTSPTAPTSVLLIETLAMLLGRLEVLIVVVALAKVAKDAAARLRR